MAFEPKHQRTLAQGQHTSLSHRACAKAANHFKPKCCTRKLFPKDEIHLQVVQCVRTSEGGPKRQELNADAIFSPKVKVNDESNGYMGQKQHILISFHNIRGTNIIQFLTDPEPFETRYGTSKYVELGSNVIFPSALRRYRRRITHSTEHEMGSTALRTVHLHRGRQTERPVFYLVSIA